MGKPLLKKILVGINGTAESMQAAMYAIVLAKQLGLSVKVVYVVDMATIKLLTNSKFFAPQEKTQYETSLAQDGNNILDYVKNLGLLKGVSVDTELLSGAVASEILGAAENFEADMIFVGGRRQSAHSLEQSENQITRTQSTTANQLMQYAQCPVVVVNKKDMEALFKVS